MPKIQILPHKGKRIRTQAPIRTRIPSAPIFGAWILLWILPARGLRIMNLGTKDGDGAGKKRFNRAYKKGGRNHWGALSKEGSLNIKRYLKKNRRDCCSHAGFALMFGFWGQNPILAITVDIKMQFFTT